MSEMVAMPVPSPPRARAPVADPPLQDAEATQGRRGEELGGGRGAAHEELATDVPPEEAPDRGPDAEADPQQLVPVEAVSGPGQARSGPPGRARQAGDTGDSGGTGAVGTAGHTLLDRLDAQDRRRGSQRFGRPRQEGDVDPVPVEAEPVGVGTAPRRGQQCRAQPAADGVELVGPGGHLGRQRVEGVRVGSAQHVDDPVFIAVHGMVRSPLVLEWLAVARRPSISLGHGRAYRRRV